MKQDTARVAFSLTREHEISTVMLLILRDFFEFKTKESGPTQQQRNINARQNKDFGTCSWTDGYLEGQKMSYLGLTDRQSFYSAQTVTA